MDARAHQTECPGSGGPIGLTDTDAGAAQSVPGAVKGSPRGHRVNTRIKTQGQ